MGVKGFPHRIKTFKYERFHHRYDVRVQIFFAIRLLYVKEFLKTLITHLVSILKFPIGFKLFLHSVIRQMHSRIINILRVYAILTARRPYISLFKHKYILVLIKQYPYPNVKLPIAYKQRPLNILLYYKVIMLNLECAAFRRMGLLLAFLYLNRQLLQLVLVFHDLVWGETARICFIQLVHLVD